MGTTVVSPTVFSPTTANDGETSRPLGTGPLSVVFASMGTGPALTSVSGGPGYTTLRVTSGTGTPAIAANNIQVTCGRAPRKVLLGASVATPGFHVASFSGNVINIGTKVAPAASTVYDLDLVVLY